MSTPGRNGIDPLATARSLLNRRLELARPPYAGPAKMGEKLPAFTATLADGSPFTNSNLQEGKPTVLVFFRGHW